MQSKPISGCGILGLGPDQNQAGILPGEDLEAHRSTLLCWCQNQLQIHQQIETRNLKAVVLLQHRLKSLEERRKCWRELASDATLEDVKSAFLPFFFKKGHNN